MARFVRVQSIRHPIGATGRFDLAVTSADVRLRAVEGSDVSLRATFEIRADSEQQADEIFQRVQLVTQSGSGRLDVREPEGSQSLRGVIDRLVRGSGANLSVEADIPPSAEVRLETVSGDVTAEGLVGAQRYTSVSGDLFATGSGGSLRINTVSGDVTVRGERPVTLRSEAVSGDLSLAVPRIDGLRTHSVSGDIEIEGEMVPAGEFRAETVSGDLLVRLLGSASFEVRGISTDISSELDHRIEGRLDRRRVTIGTGGPTFVFSSMSGDLSIRRPRRVKPLEPGAEAPAPRPAAAERHVSQADQLTILQALERGEIDVDEAARRLRGDRDA
jgi:DUF4097 and DUF4098 domain-containing protein YvlB